MVHDGGKRRAAIVLPAHRAAITIAKAPGITRSNTNTRFQILPLGVITEPARNLRLSGSALMVADVSDEAASIINSDDLHSHRACRLTRCQLTKSTTHSRHA